MQKLLILIFLTFFTLLIVITLWLAINYRTIFQGKSPAGIDNLALKRVSPYSAVQNLHFTHKNPDFTFDYPAELGKPLFSRIGPKYIFKDSKGREVLSVAIENQAVEGKRTMRIKTGRGDVWFLENTNNQLVYQISLDNKFVILRGTTYSHQFEKNYFDSIIYSLRKTP